MILDLMLSSTRIHPQKRNHNEIGDQYFASSDSEPDNDKEELKNNYKKVIDAYFAYEGVDQSSSFMKTLKRAMSLDQRSGTDRSVQNFARFFYKMENIFALKLKDFPEKANFQNSIISV